jgi:RTX calcium-binding nonapeptide repeat (4 copies)
LMRRVALTVVWSALALALTAGVASAAGVYGTYSDENVHGTSENDFISPGAGADGVYGYEGDDVVYAADTFYPGYTA